MKYIIFDKVPKRCVSSVHTSQQYEVIHEAFGHYLIIDEDKMTCIILKDNPEWRFRIIEEKKEARVFESGAKRDSNQDKIRPDLISPYMLKALGKVLADGAKHYGERNWERGIPQEVFKESASRHFVSWLNNEEDEDHAAKLIFNIMGYIHNRDKKQ